MFCFRRFVDSRTKFIVGRVHHIRLPYTSHKKKTFLSLIISLIITVNIEYCIINDTLPWWRSGSVIYY